MGTGRKFNKKPVTRPKKKPRERDRRVREQQKRVIELGYSEDAVVKMTPPELRDILRKPVTASS